MPDRPQHTLVSAGLLAAALLAACCVTAVAATGPTWEAMVFAAAETNSRPTPTRVPRAVVVAAVADPPVAEPPIAGPPPVVAPPAVGRVTPAEYALPFHHRPRTPGACDTCASGIAAPCGCDGAAAGVDPRDCVRVGDLPGSILIPGSDVSLKIGGYAKLDFIYDFNPIASTDSFVVGSIPTDGAEGRNVRLHARQTRLNLDARRPTDRGEFRVFVEGDFFGEGNSFRLRHGFGSLGPLLAGRTWSTLMDETILPDLVDFESPTGLLLTRRALVRWTQPLPLVDGLEYSLAVEDPSPVFRSPDGQFENELPDFVGRLRLEREGWHLQAAGFFSRGSFIPDVGTPSADTAWGFNFTGYFRVLEHDKFSYQLALGDGGERFRGEQSYLITTAGELLAIPGYSWYLSYQHFWTDKLQSVFAYSQPVIDDLPGFPDAPKRLEYLAANILWSPSDHVTFGVEYIFGRNEAQDGASGTANRFQAGIWWFLP